MNCIAITTKGTQCTRKANHGKYCWQHNPDKEEKEHKKPKSKKGCKNLDSIDITHFFHSGVCMGYYNNQEIEVQVELEDSLLVILPNNLKTLPPIIGFKNVIFVMLPELEILPEMTHTAVLNIARCNNLRKLPELPNLKYLNIEESHSLTTIPSYPQLKRLSIDKCIGLRDFSDLPNLEILSAQKCHGLRIIPYFPKLKTLVIDSSPHIADIAEMKTLENLSTQGCELSEIPRDLPNLKMLMLCGCLVTDLPNCPDLEDLCTCGNPVFKLPNYPKLNTAHYNKLLQQVYKNNCLEPQESKNENSDWLLKNSQNTEDLCGDEINTSKSSVSIGMETGKFYLFTLDELLESFNKAESMVIYDKNPLGYYQENLEKPIYKEPYTGCWIQISNLFIITILRNFILKKINKFRIGNIDYGNQRDSRMWGSEQDSYDVYQLVPISIHKLKNPESINKWTLDDINRSGIKNPGIVEKEGCIYLGNLENAKLEGPVVCIAGDNTYRVLYL